MLAAASAQAAIIVDFRIGGASSVQVVPGQSVTVDVYVTATSTTIISGYQFSFVIDSTELGGANTLVNGPVFARSGSWSSGGGAGLAFPGPGGYAAPISSSTNVAGDNIVAADGQVKVGSVKFVVGTPVTDGLADITGCFNCVNFAGDGNTGTNDLTTKGAEQCDDGNTNAGDGCSPQCTDEVCGNGIQDSGESCDDGNSLNSDSCLNDCTFPVCGDEITSAGEECDDGNLINIDFCRNDCNLPFCGDGLTSVGEQCDDGNAINTDSCRNDCLLAICGDSLVSISEECDDGNTVPYDGCSPTCQDELCGNGLADPGEECDDANFIDTDSCRNDCTLPICGDGVTSTGEECDDGNAASDDGCSYICDIEFCGDGVTQTSEECDDGAAISNDGCSATCLVEICGDGITQTIEECDDGGTASNDGCSATCVEEICGDGITQTIEECDDGNLSDADSCLSDCTLPICGDGLTSAGEECDDGNTLSTDTCRADCTFPVCGDGIASTGEECDDGNTLNDDGCSPTCDDEVCGDGITQLIEECDDGNIIPFDGCSPVCEVEYCGNGFLDSGEQCDDGNILEGDGCSQVCLNESACSGNDNPIANCSFENDFANWVTSDHPNPFVPLAVDWFGTGITGFVPWVTEPTDGAFSATHGFDGGGPGTIEIGQDIVLPPFEPQLTFDYRAGWNMLTYCIGCSLSRTFSVRVEPSGGGVPLQSTVILTADPGTINLDTGVLTATVDLRAFAGQEIRLNFVWDIQEAFTGPAAFELDNIVVGIAHPVPALGGRGHFLLFGFFLTVSALSQLRRQARRANR